MLDADEILEITAFRQACCFVIKLRGDTGI